MLTSTISVNVFAQSKMSADEMALKQTEEMTKVLELDEEQSKKIYEINLGHSNQLKEIMDRPGSMMNKMGDVREIRSQKDRELEDVLSEDQMKLYKNEVEPKMRKRMRKDMKNGN